ncbi:MAG: alcohol dehydrogenase catalytic domain-containing protein [Caldilineales bacterium]
MNALRFDGTDAHIDTACPVPVPADDEALVSVSLAGICSTDLEILRGYAGFSGVLGHEFVGVVEACPGRPELVGRRVAGEINIGCGECAYCARGVREHCLRRQALGIHGRDGVFAQFVALPVANLHLVPDNVTDEAAVFTEPLAAAFQIREQVAFSATDRIAVVGAGRLGQLVARALADASAELVAVGRDQQSRKLAILRAAGVATAERGQLPAGWADVVVDCTGSPAGFADALDLVRAQGVLVLKSTYHGAAEVDMTRVVVDEIQVIGSRCGPFDKALAALASGQVDPRPLIDAQYPLIEGLHALEHAARPGVLKVLLRP